MQSSSKPDIANPNGIKEFKVDDHLGSTRALVANATPVTTYDYSPWSSLLSGTAPRKSFIDKERDKESGLGNFGVREYTDDADGGRFLRPDRLWEKFPDETPYNYADNNPVLKKDPNGDCPLCWIAGAAAFGPVVGGGIELYKQWDNPNGIDWGKVGGAAVHGAITGAVAGASVVVPGMQSVGASIAAGTAAEVAGGMADRAIAPEPGKGRLDDAADLGKIGTDAAIGLVSSGIRTQVAKNLEPFAKGMERMSVTKRLVFTKTLIRAVAPSAGIKAVAAAGNFSARVALPYFSGVHVSLVSNISLSTTMPKVSDRTVERDNTSVTVRASTRK